MTETVQPAPELPAIPESLSVSPFFPLLRTMVVDCLSVQQGETLLVYLESDASEAQVPLLALADLLDFRVIFEFKEPTESITSYRRLAALSKAVLAGGVPDEMRPKGYPEDAWNELPDLDATAELDRVTTVIQWELAKTELEHLLAADKVLVLRPGIAPDEEGFDIDEFIVGRFAPHAKDLKQLRIKEKPYSLTRIPTRAGAELFGFESYEAYRDYCLKSLDRDWRRVYETQKKLVEKLDAADSIELVATPPEGVHPRWGVQLTASIKGFSFINSTIGNNVPGSEVFSAPAIDSVSGHYSVPNPFIFYDANGKQVTLPSICFDVAAGEIQLDTVAVYDQLDDDSPNAELTALAVRSMQEEGMTRFGEIGIGTNPLLDRPTGITLFDEKALGVHLAIGKNTYAKYEKDGYTSPFGVQPIQRADNGNSDAARHIDLVRTAHSAGGSLKISLDGEVLLENGLFVDPELEYLSDKI